MPGLGDTEPDFTLTVIESDGDSGRADRVSGRIPLVWDFAFALHSSDLRTLVALPGRGSDEPLYPGRGRLAGFVRGCG